MKTIKVSEIKGTALDWAVAQCEGKKQGYAEHLLTIEDLDLLNGVAHSMIQRYRPSTNWAQGGPIIEREMIQLTPHCMINPLYGWAAAFRSFDEDEDICALHRMRGKTPLLAGMRCYVASKLGDKVEVPKELL